MDTSSRVDFTSGKLPKKLLRFMLPILAALALQAMYGAVDALIVGRLGTNAGLSGVSTGSVLTNLLTMVITQFSMGNTVLIGRYSGEGHPEKLKKVVGGTIAIFAVFAAILFVIMAFFAQPLAILLQAPEEAVDATVSYIRICRANFNGLWHFD